MNDKIFFFNSLADQWDYGQKMGEVIHRLDQGLNRLGVGTDEYLADIGCGTGNLTTALLKLISPAGKVLAVDFSPAMIEKAKSKNFDSRVCWHCGAAESLPVDSGVLDRIICFAVWPHFDNPSNIACEFLRTLKPGGHLHIWHLISRDKVNHIHQEASPVVQSDSLAKAEETAAILTASGFEIELAVDNKDEYLVTGRKPENSE